MQTQMTTCREQRQSDRQPCGVGGAGLAKAKPMVAMLAACGDGGDDGGVDDGDVGADTDERADVDEGPDAGADADEQADEGADADEGPDGGANADGKRLLQLWRCHHHCPATNI